MPVRRNPSVLAAFCLSLVLSNPLAGQVLPMHTYDVRDGLGSAYVTAIGQDARGYLWVGTDEGVSKFDGTVFENHPVPPGVIWGQINWFHESRSIPGVMWVGTNGGGLLRFHGDSVHTFRIGTSPASNRVNAIYEDVAGAVWCATDDGLYLWSRGSSNRLAVPSTNREAMAIVEGPDSTILVLFSGGIATMKWSTHRLLSYRNDRMIGTNSYSLKRFNDGELALLTVDRLLVYRNGRLARSFRIPKEIPGVIERDVNRDYWVASYNRLYRLSDDGTMIRSRGVYTIDNGLPANGISCAFSDRDGNLWFGTYGKGLVSVRDLNGFRFPIAGLTGRGAHDRTGRIWIPTVNGFRVIRKEAGGGWGMANVPADPRLGHRHSVAVKIDARDRMWTTLSDGSVAVMALGGNGAGVPRLHATAVLSERQGIPKVHTVQIFVDSRGYVWCPKAGGGVVAIDGAGTRRTAAAFDTAGGPMYVAFTEDRQGNVWAGGNGSGRLVRFVHTQEGIRREQAPADSPGVSAYGYRSAACSRDGVLWFGTRYEGIVRLDGAAFRRFTTSDGLHSNQVFALAPIGSSMWLGTQRGLEFLPSTQEPQFQMNQEVVQSPVNDIGMTPDGVLWAVTRDEVALLERPGRLGSPPSAPVYLTRCEVNGLPRSLDGENEFTHQENTVTLKYACVIMSGAADVRYQYRLEGTKGGWEAPTRERSVTYAHLPPGRYRFQVRALLSNGSRVTEPVEMEFSIVPPWWKHPAVLLVSVLGILTAIGLWNRSRWKQRLAIEQIRSSIAADLHDDIGSALARIAVLAEILTRSKPARTRRTTNRVVRVEDQAPERIARMSRELLGSMSDVVWAIDPRHESFDQVAERLRLFATEIAEREGLRLEFANEILHSDRRTEPRIIRNLLLIGKEALTNIAKHARASEVSIRLRNRGGIIDLIVSDNGRGFAEETLTRTNGLQNIRMRAVRSGGRVTVTSFPGNGTTIHAELPASNTGPRPGYFRMFI